MEAIGRKLELGIFRTSKPIKEDKKNDGKKEKIKKRSAERKVLRSSTNSPTKPSDAPLTQTLLMMKKREKECFANATVQKDSICREAAHKTISVPIIIPHISQEKAQLTVAAPKKTSSLTSSETKKSDKKAKICDESNPVTNGSYSQLVELKLAELAEQAEHLARALRKTSNDDIDCDDDNSSNKEQLSETTTQFDVDSATLDTSEEDEKNKRNILKVEIAAPVVKASEQLSLQSPKSSKEPNKESSKKTVSHNSKATNQDSSRIVTNSDNFDLKRLAEATKSLLELADNQGETKPFAPSDSEAEMRARRIPPAMSTSEIHLTDRGRESLADRLSKGLHDLTHGSTDRLQKWKTKLHTGRRAKDQSEPPPTNRSQYSSTMPATDVLLDWTSVRSPRPLHSSKSATNALKDNIISPIDGMEHRTLKSKENSVSQKDLTFHYQNMNSLQKIMNTMDNFAKTSQFNLPPPVRITPHSGVKPTGDDILRPIAFRPVTNQTFEDYKLRQSQDMRNFERQVIRGDANKNASYICNSNNQVQRPRQIYQQTTNFPVSNKPIENEYDTVPEYLEKEKFSDFCSSGSDYGSFVPPKLTSSMASSGTGSSHLSSPSSTNKKPSLGRSASGVHITPSPSDSGIVDFEAVIRDKENELREVRSTMEQNEEIIVKVYQEKEKLWKEELDQLRQRLAAAERGEQGLRTQLAGCQRQTETLTRTVEGLRDEKSGLLRKCFQIERELASMKSHFDKPRVCEECNRREKPIPAPRQQKDSDTSIRSEVSSLRDEVATLKEALQEQMKMFSSERKGWEDKQTNGQTNDVRDRLI
ncbi:unnamed protein product [Auanema sp. JU1783]|nr:unnamed protein product [Auanema sp. JU1783]